MVGPGIASDMAFGDAIFARLGLVWESYVRPWRGFQNIIRSMAIDPENMAELAADDAKKVRDNLPIVSMCLVGTAATFMGRAKAPPGVLKVVLNFFAKALTALGYGGRVGSAAYFLAEGLSLAWDGDVKAANKMFMYLTLAAVGGPGLGSAVAHGADGVASIQAARAAQGSGTALAALENWLTTTAAAVWPEGRMVAPLGPALAPVFWSVGTDASGNLPATPGQPRGGVPYGGAPARAAGRGTVVSPDTVWTVRDVHPDLIAAARAAGPAAMRWLREHRYGLDLKTTTVAGLPSVTATLKNSSREQLATITLQGVVLPGDNPERLFGMCVAVLLDKIGVVPLPTTAPRPGNHPVRSGHSPDRALLPRSNPIVWEHRKVDSFVVEAAKEQGEQASAHIDRLGLEVVEVHEPYIRKVPDRLNPGQEIVSKWQSTLSKLVDKRTKEVLAVATFRGPIFEPRGVADMSSGGRDPVAARKAVLLELAYENHPELPLYRNPDTLREERFRLNSAAPRPSDPPYEASPVGTPNPSGGPETDWYMGM